MEVDEKTNHNTQFGALWLVGSSASASNSNNLVFTGTETWMESEELETLWFLLRQLYHIYESLSIFTMLQVLHISIVVLTTLPLSLVKTSSKWYMSGF